jgi:UDP-N-acetylmuramyl pentapeptide synthase
VLSHTRVVIVVGSLGKTTAARAASVVLDVSPDRLRGNAQRALPRRVLRTMPWHRSLVAEVGVTKSGQMAPLAQLLRPDIVVVTSIASEHNRSFGSLEATREEKAEMVRGLSESGLAILNGDDPNVRWMATQTDARVTTFGLGEGNDVRRTDVELVWPTGTRLTLEIGGQRLPVETRLVGWPMVYSFLAGVAVGLAEGVPLEEVLDRLANLAPTSGRLEVVSLDSGAFLLRDDYKSTLETVDAALDVLASIPARRRIVVLGEVSEPPGSQGPIYRRLGARIAEIADLAVFVGVNFQRYAAGARRAGFPSAAMTNAGQDVLGAAEVVRAELGPGDVVLIKGRDTQRLDRIGLALAGRRVRCTLEFCDLSEFRCDRCPLLEETLEASAVAR